MATKAQPGENMAKVLLALLERGSLATREAAAVLERPDEPGRRAALDALKRLVKMDVAQVVGEGAQRRYALNPLRRLNCVTSADRLALRVGRDAVSFLHGTLLGDGLEKAAADDVSWDHLDRKLVHRPEPEVEYEQHQEVIDVCVDAVVRQRRIQVSYDGRNGVERHVGLKPLSLVVYRRALYLLCVGDGVLTPLRLRVDRMLDVPVAGERFEYPEGWDPEAELAPWFGMVPGKSVDTVLLRFSAQVARYVRGRRWHPSYAISDLEDGRVLLQMQTGGPELVRFVLEWGRHCEVLAPEWLREAVKADSVAEQTFSAV